MIRYHYNVSMIKIDVFAKYRRYDIIFKDGNGGLCCNVHINTDI
mgnify:FL=1